MAALIANHRATLLVAQQSNVMGQQHIANDAVVLHQQHDRLPAHLTSGEHGAHERLLADVAADIEPLRDLLQNLAHSLFQLMERLSGLVDLLLEHEQPAVGVGIVPACCLMDTSGERQKLFETDHLWLAAFDTASVPGKHCRIGMQSHLDFAA